MPFAEGYDSMRGTAGLTPGSGDEAEVLARSDEAKRLKRVEDTRRAAVEENAARGLKAATTGEGEVPKSIHDQAVDAILTQTEPDATKDRAGYMKRLETRYKIITMKRDSAKKIGNTGVMNTYAQVADLLLQKMRQMQSQDAGIEELTPQAQPSERQPEQELQRGI